MPSKSHSRFLFEHQPASPLGSCEELPSRHRRTLRAMALRHAAQRLAQRAAPSRARPLARCSSPFYRHMASDANLLKTALYDFHLRDGRQDGASRPCLFEGAPVIRGRCTRVRAGALAGFRSVGAFGRCERVGRDSSSAAGSAPSPRTARHGPSIAALSPFTEGKKHRINGRITESPAGPIGRRPGSLSSRRPLHAHSLHSLTDPTPTPESKSRSPSRATACPSSTRTASWRPPSTAASKASIFDASHMLGSSMRGKDAIEFVESIVVGDIRGLKNGTGTLSVVTNDKGGIAGDTVVTKVSGERCVHRAQRRVQREGPGAHQQAPEGVQGQG